VQQAQTHKTLNIIFLFFKLANAKTICKKVKNYEIVVHWSNRVKNMFFMSFVFIYILKNDEN
jgi:hypothetical protein